MTETTNTTETPVRPADIVEQLLDAGVDRDLTIKVFECIETERAAAIAKAARLFYRPDREPPLAHQARASCDARFPRSLRPRRVDHARGFAAEALSPTSS